MLRWKQNTTAARRSETRKSFFNSKLWTTGPFQAEKGSGERKRRHESRRGGRVQGHLEVRQKY